MKIINNSLHTCSLQILKGSGVLSRVSGLSQCQGVSLSQHAPLDVQGNDCCYAGCIANQCHVAKTTILVLLLYARRKKAHDILASRSAAQEAASPFLFRSLSVHHSSGSGSISDSVLEGRRRDREP